MEQKKQKSFPTQTKSVQSGKEEDKGEQGLAQFSGKRKSTDPEAEEEKKAELKLDEVQSKPKASRFTSGKRKLTSQQTIPLTKQEEFRLIVLHYRPFFDWEQIVKEIRNHSRKALQAYCRKLSQQILKDIQKKRKRSCSITPLQFIHSLHICAQVHRTQDEARKDKELQVIKKKMDAGKVTIELCEAYLKTVQEEFVKTYPEHKFLEELKKCETLTQVNKLLEHISRIYEQKGSTLNLPEEELILTILQEALEAFSQTQIPQPFFPFQGNVYRPYPYQYHPYNPAYLAPIPFVSSLYHPQNTGYYDYSQLYSNSFLPHNSSPYTASTQRPQSRVSDFTIVTEALKQKRKHL